MNARRVREHVRDVAEERARESAASPASAARISSKANG
jgi:hypothetical protein